MDVRGKKVVVLGLGDTGLSMTRWLHRHGAQVAVADTRAAPPHAVTLQRELPQVEVMCGEFQANRLRAADLRKCCGDQADQRWSAGSGCGSISSRWR